MTTLDSGTSPGLDDRRRMVPDPDRFAVLAREFAAANDFSTILRHAIRAAQALISGVEHAGVLTVSGKLALTTVATDDLVRQLDRKQRATGQGPGLTAAFEHETAVHASDLPADPRWPAFAAAAAPVGILSVLSFSLHCGTTAIGALTFYAAPARAFTVGDIHAGTLLAAHAAVAADAVTTASHLHTALQSRDTIGQAKGILMERYKITAEQAFFLLTTASQRNNRKLRDVAGDLTATGELAS